jgi:hypothetical protein
MKAVKTDNGIKTEILTEELATRGIAADAYLYDEGSLSGMQQKTKYILYNKNLKSFYCMMVYSMQKSTLILK